MNSKEQPFQPPFSSADEIITVLNRQIKSHKQQYYLAQAEYFKQLLINLDIPVVAVILKQITTIDNSHWCLLIYYSGNKRSFSHIVKANTPYLLRMLKEQIGETHLKFIEAPISPSQLF